MDVQLWADIAKVSQMADVSFILCGDFLQFPAICEFWAGSSVPEGSLECSHMIRDLADGNRLTLTENKRSDEVLFNFYTSLSSRPLAELLQEARVLFPVTSRLADTTLVISHARRRYLNCKRNLSEKPPSAVFLRAPITGSGTGPQSMFVWAGLRVVGSGGAVKKGVFEIVASVTEDGDVTLSNGVRLTAHQAIRSLRLCWAITYAGCQGLTLEGVVRLDCTDSQHFTARHVYVGSSRATSHQLLEVV